LRFELCTSKGSVIQKLELHSPKTNVSVNTRAIDLERAEIFVVRHFGNC